MDSITRKKLLYRSKVEYAQYGINHVEGCAHGCKYCYARLMKHKSYYQWIKPKIVANSVDLLFKDMQAISEAGKVYLCFTTDPYMSNFPEVSKLTNAICAVLLKHGFTPVILTKGILNPPEELLGKGIQWGITLVDDHEEFSKKYEPFSPSPQLRYQGLYELFKKGEYTWVSLEPYPPPEVTNYNENYSATLQDLLIRLIFAKRIVFGKWNYFGFNNRKFYVDRAEEARRFCQQYSIECIVKKEVYQF